MQYSTKRVRSIGDGVYNESITEDTTMSDKVTKIDDNTFTIEIDPNGSFKAPVDGSHFWCDGKHYEVESSEVEQVGEFAFRVKARETESE